MFYFIFANAIQFVVCAAALARGGREERVFGGALLLNILASKLSLESTWTEPEYATLAADVALLAVLIFMALRTTRWWLLWCAAFELLIVVTHVAIVVDPTVRGRSYATGSVIWSYMVVFSLAAGTWSAWRRRAH